MIKVREKKFENHFNIGSIVDGIIRDIPNPLDYIWEIEFNKIKFYIFRYRNRYAWNKIVIMQNNQEMYRLIRDGFKYKEIFGDVFIDLIKFSYFREYEGNQYNFIKFINDAIKVNVIPSVKNINGNIGNTPLEYYQSFLKVMLENYPSKIYKKLAIKQ